MNLDTSIASAVDSRAGKLELSVDLALLKKEQDIAKTSITELLNGIPDGQAVNHRAPRGQQVRFLA